MPIKNLRRAPQEEAKQVERAVFSTLQEASQEIINKRKIEEETGEEPSKKMAEK